MQDFFFHAIAKLSLTLSTLINSHPSTLPPPYPPEHFRLGRFTTALFCTEVVTLIAITYKKGEPI